jgi:hypothetical protein
MNLSTSLLQSLSGIGGDAPGEKLNKSWAGIHHERKLPLSEILLVQVKQNINISIKTCFVSLIISKPPPRVEIEFFF